MFTNRKPRRNASTALANACAFEQLEGRRLMRSPVDLPTLPPLPAAPAKPPVVADATPPVQNPGYQRPTTPDHFEGVAGHDHEGDDDGYSPDFMLNSKWGQPGGFGTPVPLTYSYANFGGGMGQLSATQITAAIEEALQLWSAVAPLQFTQVTDVGPPPSDIEYPWGPGIPQMRYGQHGIDGPGNFLAHAYFPGFSGFPGFTGLAGDTHFDSAENWSVNPGSGRDLIEVATHETGHALGLDHQPTNVNAIMNPFYSARYSGPGTGFLLPDDIAGMQVNYGAGLGYVLNSAGTMFISGTEGANTITLSVAGGTISATSSGMGSFARSMSGVSRIVINSRGGNDIVRIESNGGITTNVNTGAGDDFVDFSWGFRDLDNVTGNVNVSGGAGNDRISIFDHNNASAATYTITDARFDRPGWGGFFYDDDVESESMTTGTAADTVNVLSTWTNQPVILNSNGGNDTVNVGNGTNGMQSIRAWVEVNNSSGQSTLNLNNGAGSLARTASVDSIPVVGYTFVAGLAPERVNASIAGVGAINLTTGTANDTVNVTRNTEALTLNSGGGSDTVNLGSIENGVQDITGAVTVNNSPWFTTLNINDGANPQARTATYDVVSGFTQVTGLAPAMIRANNADIQAIKLTTGTALNTVNVARNTEVLTLDSRGSTDRVNLGNAQNGMQSITGEITLDALRFRVISLDNAADTTGRTATIDQTTVGLATYGRATGLAPATIRWNVTDVAASRMLLVDTGAGNDALTVGSMPTLMGLFVRLFGGNNTIDVHGTGIPSTDNHIIPGPGFDDIRVHGTSAPLYLTSSTGDDHVSVNTDGAGTARVNLSSIGTLGNLVIGNGGTATVEGFGATALVTRGLNIANGGRLDLTDESLIWDYTGASPVNGLRQLLTSGYNGGAWNGSGVMSSSIGSNALGYAESTDLFTTFPATFAGRPVDSTALLVKQTFYGDANLDGTVNLQDFNRLTANFGQSPRRWSQGNFDYDDDVDLLDFNKLAGNFGAQGLGPESAGGGGDEDEPVPSLEDLLAQTSRTEVA